jgi:hypothetical protein
MFFAIFWAAYIPIGVIVAYIVGEWLMHALRWRFAQRISPQQHQLPNEQRDDEHEIRIRPRGTREIWRITESSG